MTTSLSVRQWQLGEIRQALGILTRTSRLRMIASQSGCRVGVQPLKVALLNDDCLVAPRDCNLIQLRYIAHDSPQTASRVAARILDSGTFVERPNAGRPSRIACTRELVVAGTSYLVPYRIRGGSLEIIAVFHGRRKWPDRL